MKQQHFNNFNYAAFNIQLQKQQLQKQQQQNNNNKPKEKNQSIQFDAYANWFDVAYIPDLNTVKRMITGSKNVWRSTPVDSAIKGQWQIDNSTKVVLDFGCGLGRNAQMLTQIFPMVVGYDLKPMIKRLKCLPEQQNYKGLSFNLHDILTEWNITDIYECVVWQHLLWDSNEVQKIIDKISESKTIKTIYSCWNTKVKHKDLFVYYLQQKGWLLHSSGNIDMRDMETLGNGDHTWYFFTRHQ